MSQPTAFAEANMLLVAPAGHEEEVGTLPIRRDDGRLVSCWQLSADDIREIARTGVVWLSIWGDRTHPPVLVTGRKEDVL